MGKAAKLQGLTSTELEARALRLEADICGLDEKMRVLRVERVAATQCLNETRQAAAAAKKREAVRSESPSVSAHAVLRYLQRRRGLDVEAIEREILTPGAVAAIRAGASMLKHDGCEFVIKDGTIVTVLT